MRIHGRTQLIEYRVMENHNHTLVREHTQLIEYRVLGNRSHISVFVAAFAILRANLTVAFVRVGARRWLVNSATDRGSDATVGKDST